MALLDVKNLTKRFGGLVANKDISLSVEAGEIVAIIGPNGAGKSTLFNLISGRFAPSAGEILLEEFLAPAGMTQAAFAEKIGWSRSRLSEFIHGKRGITATRKDDAAAFEGNKDRKMFHCGESR